MSHTRQLSVRRQPSIFQRRVSLSSGAEASAAASEELDSAEPQASSHAPTSKSHLETCSYDDISSILSREDALLSHAPDKWAELVLQSPANEEVQRAEKKRKSSLLRSEADRLDSFVFGWAGQYTSWLKVGKLVVNGNEHALERTHKLHSDFSKPGAGWGRYHLMRDVILTAKGLYIVEAHTDVRTKGRGVIDVIPLMEIKLPLRVDGDREVTGFVRKCRIAWRNLLRWWPRCKATTGGAVRQKASFLKLPLPRSCFLADTDLHPESKRAALTSAIASAMEIDENAVQILTVARVNLGSRSISTSTVNNPNQQAYPDQPSHTGSPAGLGIKDECVVDFSVRLGEAHLGKLQDPMRLRFEVSLIDHLFHGVSTSMLPHTKILLSFFASNLSYLALVSLALGTHQDPTLFLRF